MRSTNKLQNVLLILASWIYLEDIRKNYNKLRNEAQREGWSNLKLIEKQRFLLNTAALFYGVFLSLLIVNLFSIFTQNIMNAYPSMTFLSSNIALVINILLSYVLSVYLSSKLVKIYISKTNKLAQIAGAVVDGTKQVAKVPASIGKTLNKSFQKGRKITSQGTKISVSFLKRSGKIGIDSIGKAGKYSLNGGKKILKVSGKSIKFIGHKLGEGSSKTVSFISGRFKKNQNLDS